MTDASRIQLTLLGDPQAVACEGDACVLLPVVSPADPAGE